MAEKVVAHCMKCKDKREMVDAKETTTKNGRVMLKGTCPECGTTMCKFVPAKQSANNENSQGRPHHRGRLCCW